MIHCAAVYRLIVSDMRGTCSTYLYTMRGTVSVSLLKNSSKMFTIRVVISKYDRLRRVMITYAEMRFVKKGCRISYWGILLLEVMARFYFIFVPDLSVSCVCYSYRVLRGSSCLSYEQRIARAPSSHGHSSCSPSSALIC